MTECMNAEIRDVLPDYVAESLAGVEKAGVTSHLAECAPCQDEVALLRIARTVRPQPVHLDIAAIVATIERSRLSPAVTLPAALESGRAGESAHRGVRDITSAPTVRRRATVGRGIWQFAAALTVVAIGSWSVYSTRSGPSGLASNVRTAVAPVAESTEQAAADTTRARVESAPATAATSRAVSGATPVGVVSVGDLSDYTDAELQRMMDRLDKWDGASSSEVMPTLPIVTVPSGGVLK